MSGRCKSKQAADAIISPFDIYQRTGAYPLNLNTVYQLMADPAAGIDSARRGSCFRSTCFIG